jgi:hypothetical protein
MCLCSPEIYSKYFLNIKISNNQKVLVIPGITTPNNCGVSIPQLIEQIFGKIPTTMVFV